MATYYVSNVASNGYIVGDDANGGLSKSDAVLTFERAIVIASDDDTIYLNDGTFTAPSSPGYWTIAETLTILPENDYGTTLAGDGVYTVRLFNISQSLQITITFGKVILDGVDVNQVCMYMNNTTLNLNTYTFNGTRFDNFILTPIKSIRAGIKLNINITDIIVNGSSQERGTVHLPSLAEGAVVIDGITLNQSGRSNPEGGVVYIHATTGSVTASVKNVSGTSTLTAGAGASTYYGIRVQNVANAYIEGSPSGLTIDGGGGSTVAQLFVIQASATDVQDSSYGQIINPIGTNGTSGGIMALIGTDASNITTDDQHNYGRIIGGTLTGNSGATGIHGPMLGWGVGGRIMGVTTSYCGTGGCGLLKGMTNDATSLGVAMSVGNKTSLCFATACYQKGSVGSIHANNTVVTSAGYAPTAEITAYDSTSSTQGANAIFANNVVTGDTLPTSLAQQGTPGSGGADTTSGGTWYLTHYDSTLGALASKWTNGDSTTYATLAAFNTALATQDCVTATLSLNLNNEFPEGSAYLGIGYKFWGGAARPETIGDPLPDFDIDIGAIQSTHGDFHPVNL